VGKILWLLPILGALAGGLTIVSTISLATSAPQQAAGYAMACALAVVPYVLVRAVMEMVDVEWQRNIKRIVHAIEERNREP
jgi:hypothetical protein